MRSSAYSYGALVTLAHAIERGDASHYVISSGSASMSKSMADVHANLAAFEPVELRDQVTESWAREPHVRTQEDCAELLRMQYPFHFRSVESDAYRRYTAEDRTVYSPEVLAYTASHEYELEYEDRLGDIRKPVLILVGEHDRTTTPRAARQMHDAVTGSELVIFPDAGHMSYVEQPDAYFAAVRDFFARHPIP